MGDVDRDRYRCHRSHRVSLHSRRGCHSHRFARTHVLQRQDVERLRHENLGHHGQGRGEKLRSADEERNRHAGGVVRHREAERGPVSRAWRSHLSRGYGSVGKENGCQGRAGRRAGASLGPLCPTGEARAGRQRRRLRQFDPAVAEATRRRADCLGNRRLFTPAAG